MKFKKIIATLCLCTTFFSSNMTIGQAISFDYNDITETNYSNETVEMVGDFEDLSSLELSQLNLAETSLGEFESPFTKNANGTATQYTGYLNSASDYRSLQFYMTKDQIINLTLEMPSNTNVDYNMWLYSIADDNSLKLVSYSNFGTYVEEGTGNTLDESISHIHTEDSLGAYLVYINSSEGYSSYNPFTLTVGRNNAGTYDGYETNDNAYFAKNITSSGTTSSLHVANDQDWFSVSLNGGIYDITASNYNVDIYSYDGSNNSFKSAEKLKNGTYRLDGGFYYVKVHSEITNDFVADNYDLRFNYLTVYDSFETAYDLGSWEYANFRKPEIVPLGQSISYYKVSIDPGETAYVNSLISDYATSPRAVMIYNPNKQCINMSNIGFDGVSDSGVVTKSTGLKYLITQINGSSSYNYVYIAVFNSEPDDLFANSSFTISKN